MSIVVVGTTFVDIKGFPEGTYIPGGRNAGRIEEVHGGVARNIAENLARVGLSPVFLSLVDHSGAAGAVVKRIKEAGVDTTYVGETDDGMGTWLAIFDHTGEVVANLSKRPNLLPIVDIIRENEEAIFADCDSIAVEIDADEEVICEVYRVAEKYNKKVYVVISNMTIALERMSYIKKSECFICNHQESEIFFGESLINKTPEQMQEYLREHVAAAGLKSMIVTMADKGAAFAAAGGECGTVAAKEVNVVDTTGAGDAFFSGVTAALTGGLSLKAACEVGTRISAAVICTTENTCPKMPKQDLGL